ncbi:unnamed protein product [Triticum turgidum subsp. durum]|uniref:Uncharacterized protein n=1 Tax=Triticum turgidum subsp. durum TaxID=4567 RepID=A0A9R0VS96_TRITD|nr:unnamed protein product [Triticum turgidum subsp. durum]
MDAAGTSKRGRRPPTKPQKLKFKPKVPSRKPKKPPAQKPQLEETKPIDEELMKTLRTGRGDAKTLRVIKDEQSAQNSDSKTLSSAAGVSFQAAQSGKHKQPKNSQKALQIPRAFPANPERFYGDEDDEDEDDDNVVREDDNDVELPESLPSSTECESSIHPAKELNLLQVSPGTECGMQQHAVAVNTRRKHCCQLGEIERQHVVVTPDVNSLLNDNRD